ncbi:hypothetical protein CQW23_34132 [Capsicum baccatum]|uniref:Uncharacterized protein n=1 Tax=Capsicum baccatum TaxID=33114 RepID=A0A2G2UZT5_CAPBA|nr:hypothetical protein CQW23_34132 [Capsicum baccatum]
MWDRAARCIRENASEVLGVSRGRAGHHRGDWWWNEEVEKKVGIKKGAYAKLVESKDEEEKRVLKHSLGVQLPSRHSWACRLDLTVKFTAELREFIYEEIKNKSSLAEDLDEFLEVNAAVKPVQVKGDRSKSALFDGRRLAKELDELLGHGIDKWELISKVWVEMLSHAAINCKANNHCKQLSKGGQLVTLVWLLMTHFGLGTISKLVKVMLGQNSLWASSFFLFPPYIIVFHHEDFN